ncbi:MAG: ABC transporter permease [Leptospiraceae bacterium]|nr:ABC transporter permease [Leptospiraceae bacterium]
MNLRYGLELAWKETRNSRGKLAFCFLSIALGTAAIALIQTTVNGVEGSIEAQTRRLVGADLILESTAPLDGKDARKIRQELLQQNAKKASLIEFNTMAQKRKDAPSEAPARSDEEAREESSQNQDGLVLSTALARVRAVGNGFPFYGRVLTKPPEAWTKLQQKGPDGLPGVILDPDLARTLEIKPGQKLRLGRQDFRMLGVFVPEPGTVASGFGYAKTLYIGADFAASTELLGRGSRVRYHELFKLPAGLSAEEVKSRYFSGALVEENVEIRTSREGADNLRRFLKIVADFLSIVGIVTLILGGLGIGSGISVFLKDRLQHGAILRSLGATPGQVFLIYFLLSMIPGILGSFLGALPGSLLPPVLFQWLKQALGSELLPVEVHLHFSWLTLFQSVLVGTVASAIFVLVPVFRMRNVSPLRVIRKNVEEKSERNTIYMVLGVALLSVLSVMGVVYWQTESAGASLGFAAAIAGCIALLYLISLGIMKLARRVPGHSVHASYGIASLYRPGNQTTSVLTSIGLGVLLLSAVYIMENSIQEEINVETREDLPNVFVIDLQKEQLVDFRAFIESRGAADISMAPMIPARLQSINGKELDKSRVDPDSVNRSWEDRLLTREYRVTYRDHTISNERVTDGEFWQGTPSDQQVSVDEDLADRLDIEVGDDITMDIQGLPLQARVTSLREVEWQAIKPNSYFVFSPGMLENAPGMTIASFRLKSDIVDFQKAMVQRFPNLTIIDISEAVRNASYIMERVSGVIRFLSYLTLANGIVILIGAVAAGRFQRLRESMLLKVLGASARDIRRILTYEYGILSFLGVLTGWLLAELVSRPVLSYFFESEAAVPYGSLSLLFAGTVALNITIGLWISREVFHVSPVQLIREEG